MINEQTIRLWFDLFHNPSKPTEVRVLGERKGKTYVGYYKGGVDLLLQDIRLHDGESIYSPINTIVDGCYGRKGTEGMCLSDTTAGDKDIAGRDWLLVDIDPVRPSGVNASDAEKAGAKKVMVRIGSFLRDMGFESPIVADSANGYHLYYKICTVNSAEVTTIIQHLLQVLDMYFSDSVAEVDTTVHNASRIAKIIGTSSAKGVATAERPQRLSSFIKIPREVKATDIAYLRKVADMLPEVEKPSRSNNYSTDFDIEDFIRQHNIEVVRRVKFSEGEKLILKECPFDPNHKAPDSAIFVMNSGAIGFKCLHNSCSSYSWRDVRLHYDPSAYDRKEYEEYQAKRIYNDRSAKTAPTIVSESSDKGSKWLRMSEIRYVDPTKFTYIPTGILAIDKKIGGMALGDVTIVSGLAGAGKTTMLDCIALNAVERGYKVGIWSGELQDFRFLQWIDQTAAGRGFVKCRAGYEDWYYCPSDIARRVNEWLDGKVWLYNNAYGNKFSQIFSDVKDCVTTNGTQLVILDNLMSMSLDAYSGDKNERQTAFINDLKSYAKEANISVILVCHPRKEMSNSLLRMESISGTFDLVNLVDNILLLHRVGKDWNRRAKDFFGDSVVKDYEGFDEVVEVAKNRTMGVKDFLVGLYFEKESRRFKNDPFENIVYGWTDPPATSAVDASFVESANQWDGFDDLPEFE